MRVPSCNVTTTSEQWEKKRAFTNPGDQKISTNWRPKTNQAKLSFVDFVLLYNSNYFVKVKLKYKNVWNTKTYLSRHLDEIE